MSQVFAFIFALLKAIPVLKGWVDQFTVWYIQKGVADLKEADRAALRKAIDEQDQRDLEKQIGDKNPGAPSFLPGTTIVDSLPGVNVVQDPEPPGN